MGHRIHEGMGHSDTDRNKAGKEISTRNLNTFITIFYLDYETEIEKILYILT